MSKAFVVTLVVAIAAVVCGVISWYNSSRTSIEPVIYPEPLQWGEAVNSDTFIHPFTVNVSDDVLEDLNSRLIRYRAIKPIQGVGFSYGIDAEAFYRVVDYWRDHYDWRKAEAKLNSLPQFTTVIHGLNVHFVHAKAKTTDNSVKRIPLLMVHGWPGSVVEFYKVIPLLIEPVNGIVFDIVAPSIPGYGFSDAPTKAGFNPIAASQLFQALMTRLGYKKYIYQGGDWGSIIGAVQARMYPDNVIGYHTNFPNPPASTTSDIIHFTAAVLAPKWMLGQKEAHKFDKAKWEWIVEEMGYIYEQSTKPDTIGIGLTDSPVGLAAYILEKFATWAEHVEFKSGKGLSNEDMLTNVMIYWVTGHIASSVRFYKEAGLARKALESWMSHALTVPTAVTCYPAEILCVPKILLHRKMPKLVHYTDQPSGGHFAAFEEPELFVKDFLQAAKAILKERTKQI